MHSRIEIFCHKDKGSYGVCGKVCATGGSYSKWAKPISEKYHVFLLLCDSRIYKSCKIIYVYVKWKYT